MQIAGSVFTLNLILVIVIAPSMLATATEGAKWESKFDSEGMMMIIVIMCMNYLLLQMQSAILMSKHFLTEAILNQQIEEACITEYREKFH